MMFWEYENKKATLKALRSVFSNLKYSQIHYTRLYRLTRLTQQPVVFENMYRGGFFIFHCWPQFTPHHGLATYSETLISGI